MGSPGGNRPDAGTAKLQSDPDNWGHHCMDLFSPRGVRQLSDLARVSLQDGPSVIEHENRERQIAVFSQLGTGAALGEVAEKLKAEIGKHPLPAGATR
jgi:multidrug efflux pump subunit AcrB